jgi:phosphatidylglycerophosphatase C
MQLAIFDLDGTITRHDTLIQYVLGYLKGRPWRLFGFLLVLPMALLHLLHIVDRGTLKASLIHWTLGGSTRSELEAWNAQFIPALLAGRGVFRDALERIARHRQSGDVLVLMSASPDLYVPAIARELGFSEATCTGVRWSGDRLHGALTTANCRGEEKARRLGLLRTAHPNMAAIAYGNAGSDIPHLKLADRGVLVNGSSRVRDRAVKIGVLCENWS